MKKVKRPKHITKADWDSVDSPPLTEKQLKNMRPAAVAAPKIVAAYRRSRGRPPLETTKVPLSIRVSPDVIAYFKAKGPGWQTRIDRALLAFVEASR